MAEARQTRDQLAAAGELATPIKRIIAYNSQGGFMANLAMAYAIDEQRGTK